MLAGMPACLTVCLVACMSARLPARHLCMPSHLVTLWLFRLLARQPLSAQMPFDLDSCLALLVSPLFGFAPGFGFEQCAITFEWR